VNRGVWAFLIRRFAGAVVFVAVVSTSALLLVRLAPGDATAELALSGADQATIDEARARLGLDRPVLSQLGAWVTGMARLDLGRSSLYNRPVADLVIERAQHTAALAALVLVVATAIGLPLGVLTGARPRGVLAAIVSPLSIALVACPPLVGALGLLLLAVSTGWLSTASGSWAVPTLALALPLAATLERLQAQATAESLAALDITAAAARGVPSRRLLWIHAARQSLRPVLGVYGIVIGTLFSGSLAVEAITGWPGIGRLMSDALVGRDLFLTAGCALAGGVLIALGNVVADVARALVDPRIREQL
jgi:peptide/nickel transport system permease protein